MEISEFIDTYSDDFVFLDEAKRALDSKDPGLTVEAEWRVASFCRMFAILMVSVIEHVLEEWKNENNRQMLETYFQETYNGKRVSNGDKVRNLCESFLKAGAPVDPEVFKDYLAIKYLRNTVVHTRWKEDEKRYLQERGFPIDTRKLNEQHWKKMHHVNQEMSLYIIGSRHMGQSVRNG